MSAIWKMIESLLVTNEASRFHGTDKAPKERAPKTAGGFKKKIQQFVMDRWDQDKSDEVMANMQRMSTGAFQKWIDNNFMNRELSKLVSGMYDTETPGPPSIRQASDGEPRRMAGASTDKGSIGAEPIPQRPDRSGERANVPAAKTVTVAPGGKVGHDVGTAGQNQPKVQPSQQAGITPQKVGPNDTKSGVVAAQKQVDAETKANGKQRGDSLARQLGVPTTGMRTNKDPQSDHFGKVAIWSPERVSKMMDPDRNPGLKVGKQDGDHEFSRTDLIKMGAVKRNAAGPVHKPSWKGFDGQRWSAPGRSHNVKTSRPDAATGNFAYGNRDTNPEEDGQDVQYSDAVGDWVLPSVYAAEKAKELAANGGSEHGRSLPRRGEVPKDLGKPYQSPTLGAKPGVLRPQEPDTDDDDDLGPGWTMIPNEGRAPRRR